MSVKEEVEFLPEDTYRFIDVVLSVRSNSQEVLDYLKLVYGRFCLPGAAGRAFRRTGNGRYLQVVDRTGKAQELLVQDEFDSYTLRCRDLYTLNSDDPHSNFGLSAYPLSYVQWSVLKNISRRVRNHHLIHAAAVSWGNRALIFPALPGRGKTTLCLSLLGHGFRFLSDEIACLDRRRGVVEPFPRAARVDERSRQLLGIPMSQLVRAPRTEGDDTQWLVDIDSVAHWASGKPAVLSYVIFLRGLGETTRLEPLSQAGALLALFKQRLGREENAAAAIFEYASFMKGVRCFNMVLGDLAEADAQIRSLVDGTRGTGDGR